MNENICIGCSSILSDWSICMHIWDAFDDNSLCVFKYIKTEHQHQYRKKGEKERERTFIYMSKGIDRHKKEEILKRNTTITI